MTGLGRPRSSSTGGLVNIGEHSPYTHFSLPQEKKKRRRSESGYSGGSEDKRRGRVKDKKKRRRSEDERRRRVKGKDQHLPDEVMEHGVVMEHDGKDDTDREEKSVEQLYYTHSNIQNILLQKNQYSSSSVYGGCTTCILISAINLTYETLKPHNLLILADGHVHSVVDYDWTNNQQAWRISSWHTKQPNKMTMLMHELMGTQSIQIDGMTSELLPHYHVLKEPQDIENDWMERVVQPIIPEGTQSSCLTSRIYRNIKVDVDSNRSTIRFSLVAKSDRKEALDVVQSSFIRSSGEQCEEIHDSDSTDSSNGTDSECSLPGEYQGPEKCITQSDMHDDYENSRSHSEDVGLEVPSSQNDTQSVTVMREKSLSHDGTESATLYHYVAGFYKSNLPPTTVPPQIIKDEILRDLINDRCEHELLSKLPEEQRQRFHQNTPCFVVTEKAISNYNINSIEPQLLVVNKRMTYTYIHSKDSTLSIRVYEPASPSDFEILNGANEPIKGQLTLEQTSTSADLSEEQLAGSQIPDTQQSAGTESIRGKPPRTKAAGSQSTDETAKKRKIDDYSTRMALLSKTLEQIVCKLRSLNREGNKSNSLTFVATTMLTSNGRDPPPPTIFIFKGIIVDSIKDGKLSKFHVDAGLGWATSTGWIYNDEIREKLCSKWTTRKTKFKLDEEKFTWNGLNPWAIADNESINNGNIAFKVPEGTAPDGAVTITSGGFRMSSIAGSYTLKTEKEGQECRNYRLIKKMPNSHDFHQHAIDEEKVKAQLLSCLQLENSNSGYDHVAHQDPSMTLSIHKVDNALKRSRKSPIKVLDSWDRADYIILSCEKHPNVILPSVQYQDPLIAWYSRAIVTKAPDLKREVLKFWKSKTAEDQRDVGEAKAESSMIAVKSTQKGTSVSSNKPVKVPFVGKMPEFTVFFTGSKCGGETHALKMKFKGDEVRVDDSKSNILQVWAHNAKVKSLFNDLLLHPDSREALIDLTLQYQSWNGKRSGELLDQARVKDFIDKFLLHCEKPLPVSFEYPTIGLEHNYLPRPNKLGTNDDDRKQGGPSSSIPLVPSGQLRMPNDNLAHLLFKKPVTNPTEITNDAVKELITLCWKDIDQDNKK